MTPATVAGFILLNDAFPRSVTSCVGKVAATLHALRQQDAMEHVQFPEQQLHSLQALAGYTTDQVVAFGMHEYIDGVQLALNEFSEAIAEAFFLA